MEQKRPQRPAKRSPGSPPLIQYRLYFLHAADRRITLSYEFEAADDERAIRIAQGWREGRGAELWTGARKLESWDPDG